MLGRGLLGGLLRGLLGGIISSAAALNLKKRDHVEHPFLVASIIQHHRAKSH
jgi:hypothetical protein